MFDGNSYQWVELSASGFSGVQGAQGATGAGSQGIQGTSGIQGGLGPQGIQGATGAGIQGVQGPAGSGGGSSNLTFDAVPPSNPNIGDRWVDSNSGATYTWMFDGNSNQWVELNPAGNIGAQGTQGVQGTQGALGNNGAQGAQGLQGTIGFQGSNGLDGAQGTQGVQGIQGAGTPVTFSPTPPVSPSANDVWIDSTSGSEYTYVNDGNSYQWVELSASGFVGAQGIQGASGFGSQGVQGIAGAQGVQGLQGGGFNQAQGVQGIAGAQGVYVISDTAPIGVTAGTAWLNSTDGSLYMYDGLEWFEPYSNYIGVQGPAGIQGPAGATTPGAQGAQGPTGTLPTIVPDATTTSTANSVGFLGLPQNILVGPYTISQTDFGKHIFLSATGTITVPANSALSLPIGFSVIIATGSGATATISCADTMYLVPSGTTGNRMLVPFGMATLLKTGTNTWYISGNGLG